MLKLEPSEAERVLVAVSQPQDAIGLVKELDRLLRTDNSPAAQDLADTSILRRRIGLSKSECAILRDAAGKLENWRMHK